MKKLYILPLLIYLAITLSTTSALPISPHSITLLTPDDIPTWYINDYWTYTVNPLIYTSPNGSFIGTITNLKQHVTATTTINHHGANIEAYEITISGTINGDLTYEWITGDLQGTIIGTSYIRQADLAELTTSITSTGTITVFSIQQPYTLTSQSDFNPTFELYDFPINIGEHWNTTTYSSNTGYFQVGDLINDTFTSNTLINETITCTTQEPITVPAGTFTTFKINHGSTDAWYAPDVGNILKTHISQTTTNTTLEMTLSLTDYNIATPEITLTANTNPSPAILNQPVSITGTALDVVTSQPLPNATITLTIPATSDQYTTTTNTNGEYNITITTPYITDNTPTTYDLGSDGIHIELSQYKETNDYILTTLTVCENTAPTNPTISGKTNGQANTEYSYIFKSIDTENDPIYLQVDWGDNTQTDWQGPFSSGEEITLSHTWTQKDTYLIRAQTKDIYNAESDWSTLEIQMPYVHAYYQTIQNFFHRILIWFLHL
jgi:hypothetical protein